MTLNNARGRDSAWHTGLAAVALLVCVCAALWAQDRRLVRVGAGVGGRRVALVMGNDTYVESPLRNARNDARTVAAALRALPEPFTVTLIEDATQAQMAAAIGRFTDALSSRDLAVVYYAGHGVQLGQENYLVPVDFVGASAAEAKMRMIPVAAVHEGVQAAGVGVLVLDACRNNPFRGTRATGGGLAPLEAQGTLVAYATAAGKTASDNPTAGNGLFTQELVRALGEPGITVYEVFKRVQQRVYETSGRQQFPAVYDGLIGDVVLRRPAATIPAAPARGAEATATPATSNAELALRAELALWEAIKDSKNPRVFEDYLRQYPAGRFRVVADDRLNEFRGTSRLPVAATPSAPAPRPSAPAPVPSGRRASGSRVLQVDTSTQMEFVWVAPGTFQMGSENGDSHERPVHDVTIGQGFELGTCEVTQSQWTAVMGNNPSGFKACGGSCPVEQVSWDDVQRFIGKLNARQDGYRYRLPTEAEWEYAARAGTTGDYAGNLDEMGWYAGDTTHPVGQKRPNAWGLYDMHGNVWEWVSDRLGRYSAGSVTDPVGVSSGADRVNRGGSWVFTAGNCRSAFRGWGGTGQRYSHLGFRLLRVQS